MNIPKAIEILEDLLRHYSPSDEGKILDALWLGIEALKRCKTLAENNPLWAAKPLPGETKE